jgi:hypothetical protein
MATTIDPNAYHTRLVGFLGHRDPFEVLAETPETLASVVRTHTRAELRTRPYAGKWTPLELIGHLGDSEWITGVRLRHVFSESEPTIIGVQQDEWVARQHYNDRDPTELVEAFRALRLLNLDFEKRITPNDHERQGRHNQRGPESLLTMVRMHAGHDLAHLDQLDRYLTAVRHLL